MVKKVNSSPASGRYFPFRISQNSVNFLPSALHILSFSYFHTIYVCHYPSYHIEKVWQLHLSFSQPTVPVCISLSIYPSSYVSIHFFCEIGVIPPWILWCHTYKAYIYFYTWAGYTFYSCPYYCLPATLLSIILLLILFLTYSTNPLGFLPNLTVLFLPFM